MLKMEIFPLACARTAFFVVRLIIDVKATKGEAVIISNDDTLVVAAEDENRDVFPRR
jgi:hypothetical protein